MTTSFDALLLLLLLLSPCRCDRRYYIDLSVTALKVLLDLKQISQQCVLTAPSAAHLGLLFLLVPSEQAALVWRSESKKGRGEEGQASVSALRCVFGACSAS